MMSAWPEYQQLARQLAELSHRQQQAAADHATQRDSITAAVTQLDQRLAAQRRRLDHLATALGQPISPPPPAPVSVTEAAQALQLARQHADAADIAAAEAEHLARQPALLPGLSPTARNLLIYAGCALVAVTAQYALLIASDVTPLGTITVLAFMCAGFPVMAWGTGYAIISTLGKPRLGDTAAPRSPRLGLAICFLAMPIAFCTFKIASSVLGP